MSKNVYLRGGNIAIVFPYDARLVALVKTIPGRRWDAQEPIWKFPLASLQAAIDVLEPEGFTISNQLRDKLPEADAARAKRLQQQEATRLAVECLEQRIMAGEVVAFVPASSSMLTRKLKKYGAYQVMSGEGYYGRQIAGLRVLERDLVATLSDVGRSTEPALWLLELLFYAWVINAEAKESRRSSRPYRYMKKGYLLDDLCRVAAKQSRFTWGWKQDPHPPANGADWVLYFECDGLQCSFHAFERGDGPDFPGDWDGKPHLTFPFAAHLDGANPPLLTVETRKKSRSRSRRR